MNYKFLHCVKMCQWLFKKKKKIILFFFIYLSRTTKVPSGKEQNPEEIQ